MKEVLLLYDPDLKYAENLAGKLSAREDVPKEIHWFSDPREMLAAVRAADRPMVIAGGEEKTEELRELAELSQKGDCFLLFLTEARGYERIGNIPAVFKYRPVSLIAGDIAALLKEGEERVSGIAPAGAQFIGVMSPVGRALKTSFCLILGQLLSQGGKALYMNFELCSGFRELLGRDFSYDLADYLYAFETGSGGLPEQPENFHGLDFIPPVRMPEDIYRTDPALISRGLLEFVRSQRYETVILDLGQDYRLGEQLLPLCSQIYVPVRRDPLCEAKAEEFTEWIRRMDGESGKLRIEKPVLPARQCYIGGRDYSEQLLWSELGDYVRELLGGMY